MNVITALVRLLKVSYLIPALLAGIFSAICAVGLMSTAAWLIASAALQPPLYTLTVGVTGVRAFGIGRAVFRYLDRWLSHRLAFDCFERLQIRLYELAAKRLPLREGPARQGEFLHDLGTGCETLRDVYLRGLPAPLITAVLTVAAFFPLRDAVGTAALLLPFVYLLHLALAYLGGRTKSVRETSAAYRSSLLDTAGGREELFFAGSDIPVKTLRDEASAFAARQDQGAKKRDRLEFLAEILRLASWILLFAFLIAAVPAGNLTGIGLAVWILLLQALLQEYRALPEAVFVLLDGQKAGQSILADNDGSPSRNESENRRSVDMTSTSLCYDPNVNRRTEIKGSQQASELSLHPSSGVQNHIAAAPVLTVTDLTFSYANGQSVFAPLSFTVQKGQHTAVIGESGAGKTTLASLLLGLYRPDSGTIRFDTSQNPVTASLQGSYIFSGSVRENFTRLNPVIDEETIRRALETAQLLPFVKTLPQGLDTPLGKNGARLSGGQQNRLKTALALAESSPLLLLDEPTAGLDRQTAENLITAIFTDAEHANRTLLIITHDLPLLSRMRQIIRMQPAK